MPSDFTESNDYDFIQTELKENLTNIRVLS